MELYQAEWCPHSHKVRQRLTELGVDFVARQVAAERDERPDEIEIPRLVTDDGEIEDVDVSVLSVALVFDYDDDETDSPWTLTLHVDARGTAEQRGALAYGLWSALN